MQLHNLTNLKGARTRRKRVGRGTGSGHGKTACRGHKGQKARAGARQRPGFEGGQMPLIRRLPKRGFRHPYGRTLVPVNIGRLAVFEEGSRVDRDALEKRGIIRRRVDGVKILGKGDLTHGLRVVADAFSAGARRKIEEAGGSVIIAGRENGEQNSKESGAVHALSGDGAAAEPGNNHNPGTGAVEETDGETGQAAGSR